MKVSVVSVSAANEISICEKGDRYKPNFILFIDCRLEIWPGYVTAAHFMEGGIMLSVDTSHKVVRETSALEVM